MNTLLDFKKKIVAEFIRLKEIKLADLKNAQRKQLSDATGDDIDFADPVESSRQQMLEEVGQQSDPIDFLAQEIALLKTLRTDQVHTSVTIGSLIHTNVSYFLVGAAQEQFTFEGKKFTGLSSNAPLFKKMEGFKNKAEFHYGNTEYVILEIV